MDRPPYKNSAEIIVRPSQNFGFWETGCACQAALTLLIKDMSWFQNRLCCHQLLRFLRLKPYETAFFKVTVPTSDVLELPHILIEKNVICTIEVDTFINTFIESVYGDMKFTIYALTGAGDINARLAVPMVR
jgi:hypothetical protein